MSKTPAPTTAEMFTAYLLDVFKEGRERKDAPTTVHTKAGAQLPCNFLVADRDSHSLRMYVGKAMLGFICLDDVAAVIRNPSR